MYIIAGLGNPGFRYKDTRHNCGFMALDALAQKFGASVAKKRFSALTGEALINGEQTLLLKPETYMNLSGHAVAEAMSFYKLPPERLIVIYDDIDLEAAALRIKGRGSAGTHNGMRSIVEQLATQDFPRIRIGIGRQPQDMLLADYVLKPLPKAQREDFARAFGDAADAAIELITNGVEAAQARFNGKSREGGA